MQTVSPSVFDAEGLLSRAGSFDTGPVSMPVLAGSSPPSALIRQHERGEQPTRQEHAIGKQVTHHLLMQSVNAWQA